jgi:cardiolipin synthase A/B
LQRAAAGVDVRILLPGPIHDIPTIRAGQRTYYAELLAGGVRLWEYQPSMMHSKTMVVDDAIAVVGSINLDPFSLNKLEEGSLVVEDPQVTAELAELFEGDLRHSTEMTESNRPRPSVLGRVVRPFRRLLSR